MSAIFWVGRFEISALGHVFTEYNVQVVPTINLHLRAMINHWICKAILRTKFYLKNFIFDLGYFLVIFRYYFFLLYIFIYISLSITQNIKINFKYILLIVLVSEGVVNTRVLLGILYILHTDIDLLQLQNNYNY